MDSQYASERFVTIKLASLHVIRTSHNLLDVKSTCIKLIGCLFFLPLGNLASLDVKGQLHKDVLLPCTVTYKDEFDYNLLVVHWQRPENDDVVYTFFDGSSHPDYQTDQYRGRTEMVYDLLPSGNLSLLLKNVSELDAGAYTCHSILKESSGFITRYVNLLVEERSEDKIPKHNYPVKQRIIIYCIIFGFILCVCLLVYSTKKPKRDKNDDEEKVHLIPEFKLQDYKKHILSSLQNEECSVHSRQLLVKHRRYIEPSCAKKTYLGENSETINADELFTPGKKQLLSRRMLLVGDAGTGKSFFCKRLQNKWLQDDIKMYTCILYISGNKIKNETSLKEICDNIYKDLSSVLCMDNVLLIFDSLDDLVCENKNSSSTQESDINTPLNVYSLMEKIMKKQLSPDTDVLIVCRYDTLLDFQKKCDTTFILLDFTEEQTEKTYNTITANQQMSQNTCKQISEITYMPAFVVMISRFSTNHSLEVNKDSSPYKILTEILLDWTNQMEENIGLKNGFIIMANQSFENLIKGKRNCTKLVEYWDTFLELYNCNIQHKYQCNMLRDMLAAVHCVWETHRTEGLIECLNFWVFGNLERSTYNLLLKSIAEEHTAKFYHFIRFFMRLLMYPDCESLFKKTQMMEDNTLELLSGWFKKSFSINSQHSEKLKLIHCIFELHNEKVTKEVLSTTEKLEFFNTPLNSNDIQALAYCFRDNVLEELDLRLCALEDKSVSQLRNIIKNSKHVMLSSNHLTKEAGKILGEILEEPNCMIKSLSLGTNQLGDHGAQYLWKALKLNKQLTNLYIYHNNITDNGTCEMVKHLQENDSLKEIHLCGNTFSNDGLTNIQNLKDTKKEIEVVLWIAENCELFQYVEDRISGLTWESYHPEYLHNLLGTVLKDLKKRDCNKDPQISSERVDMLIQNIETLLKQEKH